MSSHLEVWKPSGRELVALSGPRVTLGKAPTNEVSLEHDPTVSRLHAILENHGSAWSIRDVGSRNGTLSTGRRSTPNGFFVPETSCDWASVGWSFSSRGMRASPLMKRQWFPTPPSSRRV